MTGDRAAGGRDLRKVFVAIVVVATVARIGLALAAPAPGRIGADPAVYDNIAADVLAGHGISRPPGRPRPTAFHPPAWSLLLAGSYAATDQTTDTRGLPREPERQANAVVMHAFVPGATDLGRTARGTYNPLAAENGYGWGRALPASDRRAVRGLLEPAKSSALLQLALDYVRRHPAAVLQASATNTMRMPDLEPSARAGLARRVHSNVLRDLDLAGFAVTAVLAILGAFTVRARRAPRWIWLIPLLMWLGVVPLGVNFSRFRVPIDPFLVLLSTLAMASTIEVATALARRRPLPRGVAGARADDRSALAAAPAQPARKNCVAPPTASKPRPA